MGHLERSSDKRSPGKFGGPDKTGIFVLSHHRSCFEKGTGPLQSRVLSPFRNCPPFVRTSWQGHQRHDPRKENGARENAGPAAGRDGHFLLIVYASTLNEAREWVRLAEARR